MNTWVQKCKTVLKGWPLRPIESDFDNALLEHGGLPYVLPLAVHLIFLHEQNGGHSKSLLLFEFSC